MSRAGLRRSRRAALAGVAVVLVTAGGLSACSKDDTATSSATTQAPGTTVDPLRDPSALGGSHGSTPDNWCDSKPPGVPMTAAEAVVKFDTSVVCPGYVTVTMGTAVTFQNNDSVAHVVTITSAPGSKDVVEQATVAPKSTWVRTFSDAGSFGYQTDAIKAMVGTVEVQDPSKPATHG